MTTARTAERAEGMTEKDRRALVCSLVQEMNDAGSWAAETKMQKCVYILKEIFGIDAGFRFMLYKVGPYSFDLQRELAKMCARLQLDVESRHPYGASFTLAKWGEPLLPRAEKHQRVVKFVADEASSGLFRDLERLSMALLMLKENPEADDATIVRKIIDHMPHLKPEVVYASIERTGDLHRKAQDMGLPVIPLSPAPRRPA